jgi:hypothetical protein
MKKYTSKLQFEIFISSMNRITNLFDGYDQFTYFSSIDYDLHLSLLNCVRTKIVKIMSLHRDQ